MSREVSIPEMLSGQEVVDAVLFRVKEMLLRDCYLNPSSAYESFEGKIHIEIRAMDSGRVSEVVMEVPVSGGGPLPEIEDAEDDSFLREADMELEKMAPNVVRVETEQPVPVTVEDSEGRKEVMRVKYARRGRTAKEK